MANKQADYSSLVSRRRFIELTGVSGATALAGCSGGTDQKDGSTSDTKGETSSNTDSSSSDTVYDAELDGVNFLIPKNVQFNPYNPNNYTQIGLDYVFDLFVQFNYAKGEFIHYAISDWTIEPEQATITIRDGLTWFNGDPVTSRDIKTQFELQKYTGGELWQYAESVEMDGDSKLVINLAQETNPTIVKHTIAYNYTSVPHSVYGEYLKKIQEAESEEEENKAIAELTEFAPTDPLGCGAFEKQSADKQQAIYTRNPDHPDAENINFERYRSNYTGGNQATWQALLSGKVDAAYTLFTPSRIVDQLPDHWRVGKPPSNWGYGLAPNYNKSPLGKREMRQGIMYVLNRKQIVNNAAPNSKIYPEIPTAIAASQQERYLGDEIDTFESYGADKTMTSKAEAKFEEAGLTKEGGQWKDSSGSVVELPILVPSGWSDWVTAAQTAADQLSSFGFNSSLVSKDFGTVLKDWSNGNFTLASFYWLPGGARSAFPYFPIAHQLTPEYSGSSGSSITWGFSGTEELTVPSRTDSGTETVELKPAVKQLAQTIDEEKVRAQIRDLAWVANQELPMLPIAEKQNQSWISSKGWNLPPEGSDKYSAKWPCSWLPRQGDMTYAGE
ncbi:ABC transporter substrate-binding protein [Halogeometricum borinquense]|uniref:ABC transporter substrate-binding protein n=1 Tax=Halogeometricum borinquense TaxID=60847 RepID=A0A6C0UEN9_9EURY|nr:ABC transporter substrate-binding protein [Halogeometricum borinquense]QIB73906.1 ABC transporter substrate-binding protein [Halogeometricum borinquense]